MSMKFRIALRNVLRNRRRTALNVTMIAGGIAAMVIFLNRTGFNGLFRLNADGEYNVPAGRYERPRIVNPPRLRAAADAVRSDPRVDPERFGMWFFSAGGLFMGAALADPSGHAIFPFHCGSSRSS